MALTKITGEGVGTLAGDTTTLTLEDTSSHSANTGPAISFKSKDSDGTTREVAKIVGESHSGSNEGNLAFQTRNGGTLETKWKVFKNGNFLPTNSAYGIYLGTTSVSDSNLLDDYEEGTWTPAWTASSGSATYNTQVGTYTKVGNIVNMACYLRISNKSSLSGGLTLSGLPFSSSSVSSNYQAVAIWMNTTMDGRAFDGDYHMQAYIAPGVNYVNIQSLDGDGVVAGLDTADINNTTDIMLSVSYKT